MNADLNMDKNNDNYDHQKKKTTITKVMKYLFRSIEHLGKQFTCPSETVRKCKVSGVPTNPREYQENLFKSFRGQ